MRRNLLAPVLILLVCIALAGCQSLENAVMDTVFGTLTPSETIQPSVQPDPTAALTEEPSAEPLPTKRADFPQASDHNNIRPGLQYRDYFAAPVSDGVFWAQKVIGGMDIHLLLFREDGTALFEIQDMTLEASQFENGSAFVTIAEGKRDVSWPWSHFSRIDSWYQVIVDTSGSILYDTRTNPEWEEKILCAGNGKYVMTRHRTDDAGQEEYLLGTVDAEGNTLDAFRAIDEAENYGKISPALIHTAYDGVFAYGDAGVTRPCYDPSYLGEGWYHLPGGYKGMLYNPADGRIRITFMDRFLAASKDGYVLGYKEMDETLFRYHLDSGKSEALGTVASLSGPLVNEDGCCFVGNRLFDAGGSEILRIDGWPEEAALHCSAFQDGRAVLTASWFDPERGSFGYLTVMDEKGHFLLDPLPCSPGVGYEPPYADGDRILLREPDGNVCWIDWEGKPIETYPEVSEYQIQFYSHGYLMSSVGLRSFREQDEKG